MRLNTPVCTTVQLQLLRSCNLGSETNANEMADEFETYAVPFLKSSCASGTASTIQTLGNIIVSIVGTGILSLPFAFRISGWLSGLIGVIVASILTCYCMLLLVECRDKLASQDSTSETKTYGDLGYKCMGNKGRCITESLVFISQCGGSVAYLVFIGQTVASIFRKNESSSTVFIFLLLVPLEILLSWIGPLSSLAPCSIFADICNFLAMLIVLKEDMESVRSGEFKFGDRKAISSDIEALPFAAGMAVFCFEGFGMTLALEASMRERQRFPVLLTHAFIGITLFYILFGFSGYLAYGDQTKDIITLSLPRNLSTVCVQIGLCLGLMFTFPVMVRPVNEIMEGNMKTKQWVKNVYFDSNDNLTRIGKCSVYASRSILIVALAVLASFVPSFGVFVSLVGGTVCAFISFVLPSTFHLILLGSSLPYWHIGLDCFVLIFGLIFAAHATYSTIFVGSS